MAASKAMETWMSDEPGRPDFRTGHPSAAAAADAARLEFDAAAMPHLNDLFRTATRILGDRSRAEDVVQEVYLQAWKSFHRFEKGTNCRAWLFKILFHCVNHHRRKWFRFPLLKDTEEFLESNLVAATPIPQSLTDGEILRALDRLPADFRAVVLLVDVEEFAYKDAAEILAVPIGTVMSRLSRGRKLLREQLLEVAQSYGIGRAAAKEQGA
ncbi:MAG: sigma-70 family RNA polymerase sigma factor [Bryobacteraceae bacterium]|nr:sigma-70 family RNA polymerase sigma factor [Bryobacteraceae bacterium]